MRNSKGMLNNHTQFIYNIRCKGGRMPNDMTHINPSSYKLNKVGRIFCAHDKFDHNSTKLEINLLIRRSDGEDECRDIRTEIVELLHEHGFYIGKLQVDF